jgi:hypothetical protein
MRILAGPCLAVLLASSLPAQERVVDTNANAWFMYFGDHPVSEKWGVHLEGQYRRHDVVSNWQQLLLRPGVNYKASENVMLTGGYAFINTHRYGEFPAAARFPEHRIFQQAVLKHGVGKAGLSHRYRLEQRYIGESFINDGGDPEVRRWRYENRFRYMLRGVIPFGESDYYLAAYDEFMVNFGKNVASNVFDQNRAYLALGRKMGAPGNLELGYMHQMVQQRNGRVLESNHTVQVAWFSQLPF